MNATVPTPAEPTITVNRKTAALALIGLNVHLRQLQVRLACMPKKDVFARELLEEGIKEFTDAGAELTKVLSDSIVF